MAIDQTKIVEMFKEGKSKRFIANTLKCKRAMVYHTLINAGLYKPKVQSWLPKKEEKEYYDFRENISNKIKIKIKEDAKRKSRVS